MQFRGWQVQRAKQASYGRERATGGLRPLEEAGSPRAHRGTEAPLGLEPMVWVPVSVNVSEGPLVYLYCTCVYSVYARTGTHVHVKLYGMSVYYTCRCVV